MSTTPASNSSNSAQPSHVAGTIEEVLRLEEMEQVEMSWADHLADRVAALGGSMAFVWFHVIWFGAWIIGNLIAGDAGFDSFPFGLLTMIVSLEAIFLAMFVLMAQNRQALRDDRRAKIDLEVNMIAEREITKILTMLAAIQKELGLGNEQDREVLEMNSETHVADLVEAVDSKRAEVAPERAEGPSSLIDTET